MKKLLPFAEPFRPRSLRRAGLLLGLLLAGVGGWGLTSRQGAVALPGKAGLVPATAPAPVAAAARVSPETQGNTLANTTQITEEAKLSIGEQIQQAQYWFNPRDGHGAVGAGVEAGNQAQQMTAHFDTQGLTLTPWAKEGPPAWSFQIKVALPTTPTAEKARAHYGPGEWFENTEKGLEHGLTLPLPPTDQSQPLVLSFPVQTDLQGSAGNDNQLLFTDAAGKRQLRYEQLYAHDAKGRRVPTALSWDAGSRSISWTLQHQGAEYPLTIDPLITRATGFVIDSSGSSAGREGFGVAVSVSGNVMAVGAPFTNPTGTSVTGAVVLYTRAEAQGPWTQLKRLTALDGAQGHNFGLSLSLNGDTLAVGAIGANNLQGAVYLFARDQGGLNQWGQTKRLIAQDGSAADLFGTSVSLSGNTLAVGASHRNDERGAVYLFERNNGGLDQWGLIKQQVASVRGIGDYFGVSVSLSGDTLAVGASVVDVGGNVDQGLVYLFSRNQGGLNQWGQTKILFAADGARGDFFGDSISLSGDNLAVGAARVALNGQLSAGAVYLYTRGSTNQWNQVKKITLSDGIAGDYFGYAVSLSGASLAVGADAKMIGTKQRLGAAYLFSMNEGGVQNWGQTTRLTDVTAPASAYIGEAVCVSGDTVAVAAPGYGYSNPTDNRGAVYLYEASKSSWAPVQALAQPPFTGFTANRYGAALAISGDTLVIGDPASELTALSFLNRGSAYVFRAKAGYFDSWQLEKILQPTIVTADSRFGASVAVVPGFIAVGAPGAIGGRGQAHLFERNQGGANNWGEIKRISAISATGGSFPAMGAAVALSEAGWLAVGAPAQKVALDLAGRVYLYARNQGGVADSWGLGTTLLYPRQFTAGNVEAAGFGAALAIEGTRLVVGAPTGSGSSGTFIGGPAATPVLNAGFAFLYDKDQGGVDTWGRVATFGRFSNFLGSGSGTAGGLFGSQVSLAGDYVLCTEPGTQKATTYHRESTGTLLLRGA
jgi:FG-GAP repeat